MTKTIAFITLLLSLAHAQEIDPARLEILPQKAKYLVLSIADEFPTRGPSIGDEIPEVFFEMVTFESIKAPIQSVWRNYTQLTPKVVWTGPLVNFVLSIDKDTQTIHYSDDTEVPAFKEGMMILNYLNFLGHYIIVGHQVTLIDSDKKIIELAYLEGNASSGKQVLEFKQEGKYTIVKHKSIYKSSSAFRDLILYPIFHRLTANEYHRHVRRLSVNRDY